MPCLDCSHPIVVEQLFQNYFKAGIILDAGCGAYGSLRRALTLKNRPFVGVDVCRANVLSLHRLNRAGDFIAASLMHLPFRSEVFDFAVSVDVIEHVHEKKQILAEITRTLKTGAHFVGSTTNLLNPFMLIDSVSSIPARALTKYVGPHYERHGRLTPKKLSQLLQSAGYCKVSIQLHRAPPFQCYEYQKPPLHAQVWLLFDTLSNHMKILKEMMVFHAVKLK